MIYIFTSLVVLAAAVVAAMLLVPRRITYTNRIQIRGTVSDVFSRIRYQRHLAKWSSWVEHKPQSGANCRIVGTEGEVGSQFLYINHKHQHGGSQVIAALVPDHSIDITLNNPGPRNFRPLLRYTVQALGEGHVEVTQHYDAWHPWPFNLLLVLLGIRSAVANYHQRDLQLLKRLVETGEEVPAYVPPQPASAPQMA